MCPGLVTSVQTKRKFTKVENFSGEVIMSSDPLDEDAVESDPRLLFIYTYLSKTTKFKVDKWQKMMNTDTYKV